jgi:hypothetical protein
MKYKIGDIVTCKYFVEGVVGVITSIHYSSWSGKTDYTVKVENGEDTFSLPFYEEDLELVEAPTAAYMDLFI